MSSIVKKSSQFTPKVKRRVLRRGSALATPPTTQVDPSAPTTQDESIQTPHTPQGTQASQPLGVGALPLLSYDMKPADSSDKAAGEIPQNVEVDPMDTTSVPEVAIEEKDNDDEDDHYENIDFQIPQKRSHRRSSVAGHRRLSGIQQYRRSGSISGTPGSQGPEGETNKAGPVVIGIPESKPVKRRTSFAARNKKMARKETPTAETATIKETPERAEDEDERASDNEADKSEAQNDSNEHVDEGTSKKSAPNGEGSTDTTRHYEGDFVYGSFENGPLMKYKTLERVESELPLVPAGLVTTISDPSQIPRRLDAADWKLLSKVEVSETFKMGDLCRPTLPFGSTSDNYEKSIKARDAIERNRKIRTEARNHAREFRIPYDVAFQIISTKKRKENPQEGVASTHILDGDLEEDERHTSNIKMTVVDGKLQVDQDSMFRGKLRATAGDRERVTENSFENPITSNSYSNLTHTDTWTLDELQQFYRALSTWGTDFTFIAQMFPYRTRRQIKRKFILEEKRNPQLVDLALKRQLPGSFEEFEKSALSKEEWEDLEERRQKSKKDEEQEDVLSGLPSKARFELEIQELQKEHKRHIEEITTERERAIKEDLEASRKREIEIRTGAKPMTRSQMKAEFKKNETVVGSLDDQSA